MPKIEYVEGSLKEILNGSVVIYPFVVKDHNSKTSIVLREGRKYIFLVPMKSGKLTVTKLTFAQFEKKDYQVMHVDKLDVINRYLAHSGGLTDTAVKELNDAKRNIR